VHCADALLCCRKSFDDRGPRDIVLTYRPASTVHDTSEGTVAIQADNSDVARALEHGALALGRRVQDLSPPFGSAISTNRLLCRPEGG
jgi:hypothetical protein